MRKRSTETGVVTLCSDVGQALFKALEKYLIRN